MLTLIVAYYRDGGEPTVRVFKDEDAAELAAYMAQTSSYLCSYSIYRVNAEIGTAVQVYPQGEKE